MARKKTHTFTEGELRIMDVLWQKGSASVREVTETLSTTQKTAYTTVMTMFGILKNKGYVDFRKEGRAYIYFPLVNRKQARSRALSHLLKRFFDNSPTLLMQNLLEDEHLSTSELESLKAKLDFFDGEEES